jgi:hypothetical protein
MRLVPEDVRQIVVEHPIDKGAQRPIARCGEWVFVMKQEYRPRERPGAVDPCIVALVVGPAEERLPLVNQPGKA